MLGVFERAGFELKRELAGGVVEVEFPIAATERFERSVEERDHTAVVASLRPFFEPGGVAVVGASPRRGTIGGGALPERARGRLRRSRVPGEPEGRRRSRACAATRPWRRSRPGRPGRDRGAGRARARRGRGRPPQRRARLVVISAGFAEIGSEGVARQEQLLALVRAHGARLIGPNCLGIAVAAPRLNATFAARSAPAATSASPRSPARSARAARGGRCARARALGLRLDREQGRRLLERPARVVGGRRGDRTSSCSTSSRSATRAASAGSPARRAAQADPRPEERHVRHRPARRQLAHRRARGLRGRRRRALPPGRRHPRALARGADRRRDAPLVAAGAEGAARRRAHERRRARHPRRRRLRRGRPRAAALGEATRSRLRACLPAGGERRQPGRHARLGDRRATSRRSRCCSTTRTSTPSRALRARPSARPPTRSPPPSTPPRAPPRPTSRCSRSS